MPLGHQVNTEEVGPSDGGREDPISDVEVVPGGHGEGVSEGDVPECVHRVQTVSGQGSPDVVSDWLPEEDIKSNILSHVARAGELSLKAWMARELVHVTVHPPGSELLLPSDHVITCHGPALSPQLVTRARAPVSLTTDGVP